MGEDAGGRTAEVGTPRLSDDEDGTKGQGDVEENSIPADMVGGVLTIGALAAEGVCFDQHFCSYPVCVPARFTMMTGLYPHHHGAVSNNTPLPLRTRTVAHHFGQAGYVSHMDACAGRILDALARLGLAENTLVVYTTDHGEMLGEHGLRGKFCFFDGSARLPLIARLPGHIPAGHRSTALVDQSDFVPTF